MRKLFRALVAPLMLGIGVSTATGQMAARSDPDGRLQATATPSKRERIQASIASMQARAVLPTQGEMGETGVWVEPATDSVTFTSDGVSDFGAVLDVALLFADSAANATAVTNVILPDPRIVSVTAINTQTVTPTTNELRPFDAVLVWTNTTPLNNVTLGDNLANYVDGGGGCVLTMFALRASVAARTIGGRFLTDDYYCIAQSIGGSTTGAATLGTILESASEVMDGVVTFDGGTSAFRTPAATTTNAVRIANWSTGEALVAQRDDLAGGRVDLGFFAVPAPAQAGSWNLATDGDILLAGALAVASKQETCQRVFVQAPPGASSAIRNTNLPGVAPLGDQQYADDFTIGAGAMVSELVLWGVYTGAGPVPPTQNFTVRVHSDAAGLPGPVIFTSSGLTVSFRNTGVINTVTTSPIFEYRVSLSVPFLAEPGVRYWLCPLGNSAGSTFAWNGTGNAGTSAVRTGDAGVWTSGSGGQMAFILCTDCFRFGDNTTTFTNSNVTRGNIISVSQPQILDSFNMELTLPANTTMWTYVMEGAAPGGPYLPIFTDSALYAGGLGQFFYGTGRMNVRLVPGRFYYVAFGWNATSIDFYRDAATYPQNWALGIEQGSGGQNGATNPVVGAGQVVTGPNLTAEYSMRMCFAVAGCRANCDGSVTPPILNVNDFTCFLNLYAAAQGLPTAQQISSRANCDNSTTVPVLNVNDFICFNNQYAAGCP